jgi:hypothetical protein
MERLSGLPGALRQTLDDSLWQSIAADDYESSYSASQTKNVALVVQPKSTLIFRVECIVATIPSGATGTVQLGDVVIPIGQGLTAINGLRLQLAQGSTRIVQSDTTGPCSLLLTGLQLPPYGVLSR